MFFAEPAMKLKLGHNRGRRKGQKINGLSVFSGVHIYTKSKYIVNQSKLYIKAICATVDGWSEEQRRARAESRGASWREPMKR